MSIEEELRAKGIDPGIWQEVQLGKTTPEFLQKNKALLEQLRGLLEKQMNDDIETVARLKELRNRAQFGGGE